MHILCYLGRHKPEEEPFHKEIIRGTGMHFAFSSEGYQRGTARCMRCGVEVRVYRSGWIGLGGGTSTPWKPLDATTDAYISSLPEHV